ncbi:MAG: M48 family metallopeptidase [Myxococcales bacterium]|nr:M48 family metallopeptidase [Myxococcales bacterium]
MLNAYGIVVLVALVGEYLLGVIVERLNLRAMAPELPPEFADVYDEETYRRSQQYARARAQFGLWPRTFGLLVVLGFWLSGGFQFLDAALRGLGLGSIATGLLFFAALIAGRSVLMLPFRIYSTFVIEERFGFNRTSAGTFVSDIAKGLVLGAILGGGFGALILMIFEQAGSQAWLLCWGATTAVIVLMQFVAPAWLMPIFIKFTPMEDGALRTRIFEYARSVDFPLDNLFVVDGSRRSTKANAFFTGFGKTRRIGLFDTLIERHSTDELVAVLAHEVGHYKKKHVTRGMWISILHLGVLFFVFGYFMRQPALFEAFGMESMSVYAGLVFCALLYSPVELVLGIVLNARSRKHEYEADAFAVETTGMGRALAEGLKKLAADSLANLTPHPAYVLLHHTHPPLRERVRAILAAST